MGLFDLVWNIHQQRRIGEAESAINRAANHTENTRSSIDELQTAVDKLALINRAMWELLSEKSGSTEEDLRARVEEIDLRDGVADGKMGRITVLCQHCNRRNANSRRLCLYCGHVLDQDGTAIHVLDQDVTAI